MCDIDRMAIFRVQLYMYLVCQMSFVIRALIYLAAPSHSGIRS